jgi:OOP family OmpA-OmpF porin
MKQNIIQSAIKSITCAMILCAALYSEVQAQFFASVSNTNPVNEVKTAGKAIRYAAGINLEAKATPLNASINSAYEDLKPRLAPCGNRLYFSRTFHPGNTNGSNDAEDIWYAEFDKATATWSEPVRMTGVLNNAGPNYVNNVSVTGDTIILGNQYTKKGKMKAGLSYSVNVNGTWSAPMPIPVQNDYNMSEHSNSFVSLQSGVIIRSIERTESLGGRDLYVSFWNGNEATEPVTMGTVINTEFEESSPFLAADNKTLYFASKGHNGLGGFDIYVTRRLDDSWTNWSQPENLGPAVNGSMDDEFFSITHCGGYAIFSKQVSVHNTDLFRISMEELFNQPIKERKEKKNIDTQSVLALASL